MATYKKGPKKNPSSKQNIEENSTTAEVFASLESSASKTEKWVVKNQGILLSAIAGIVLLLLGYLAYNNYVKEPKEKLASNSMSFAKLQFNDAMTGTSQSRDSLLQIALNGTEQHLGFLSISKQYSSTKAGNLSNYYAGISYLKMNNHESALKHLQKFSSDDEFLEPIANGAIGDIYSDLNQPKKALQHYKKAANQRENNLTSPIFLFKAGNAALAIKNYQEASKYFEEIKTQYPNSEEAEDIDSYLNIAKYSI